MSEVGKQSDTLWSGVKAAGSIKLLNLVAMQEECGKLQAQKEALYAYYGKLKTKVKEYDVIKQNIDSILK